MSRDDEYGEAGDDTTAECAHCGEMIYDDAERCPECGGYLSSEDAAVGKPAWVIAGVVICLLIVLLWVVGGLI